MCVGCNPMVHFGDYPETVDTASDNGQQSPKQPVAEKGSAGAVKIKSFAVDYNMRNNKFIEKCV